MQNTSKYIGQYIPLSSALGQRRIRPVVMVASILFSLLYFLSLQLNSTRIALDLSSRAMAVISHPDVQVEFQGRDAVVFGTVASIQEAGQILDRVQSVWGVRTVDNQLLVQKISAQDMDKNNPAYPLLSTGELTLNDLEFASNSAALNANIQQRLDEILAVMQLLPNVIFQISGHTDNTGTKESNISLSLERAMAVKHYFVKKGFASERLLTKGFGSSQPIADNRTEKGRSQNRRIEIVQVKSNAIHQGAT